MEKSDLSFLKSGSYRLYYYLLTNWLAYVYGLIQSPRPNVMLDQSLHSTPTALSKTMNHWLINIDKGNKNSDVFLDINRVFDTVNHRILLDKCECYGIKDQELNFFQSYLSNRMQCCNVNGQTSSFRVITCGVPQGSTLEPLLFIIYFIYDLPLAVKDAEITLYADDTSLYKAFKNIKD